MIAFIVNKVLFVALIFVIVFLFCLTRLYFCSILNYNVTINYLRDSASRLKLLFNAKGKDMELFDLYDINRRPLGITMERGGVQPKGAYRLVVHICIFSSDHKMLCQKRVTSKKVFPALWDLSCGGCVDSGETSIQGAVREANEELGINLPADVTPSVTVYFNYGFDDVYCVTMDVDANNVKLQAEEVAEVKWLTKEQIHAQINGGTFIPYAHEYIDYLFFCQNHMGLTDRETPLIGDVK